VAWSNVRGEIRDTARALWDTHRLTAGEVDQTLRQLIVVTNDYETSLRAVGLVHDIVAATGLGVEQSTRLLGRAMNGDINVFNRYGVAIDGTRDVLEQLTERFAGAAKAGTSATQSLAKAWQDFKEQIGLVMIDAGRGASILDTLTDSVRAMTDWVERNTQAFVTFFDYGIVPVARGLKMLAQAVVGVAKVFTGVLFGVLSAGAHGLALLADAAGLAERAKARFLGLFTPARAAAVHAQADAIQANARALREWAQAAQQVGRETAIEGLFPGRPEAAGDVAGRTPPALRPGGVTDEANAAKGAVDELLKAMDTVPDATARMVDSMAVAHLDGAHEVKSIWVDTTDAIAEEMEGLGQSLGGMFLAWASGGLKGLARFAKVKVLENLAYAVENIAKAIMGDPRGVVAAKQHGVAAAKWGAVAGAASAGAGGGSGAGGAGPSIGGPSSGPAQRAEPAGPEINIHFVGPGFDAVNPEVQRIVYGAEQYARERFGADAKVRVHRSR
jgi:hypothetical protein